MRPNRHLVGYQPAERLLTSQLATLQSCGFDQSDIFVSHVLNFPYSVKALQAVNEALIDFIPGPALYGFPDEPTGTLMQLPYSEWIQDPRNFGADAGLEALTRSFFRFPPSLLKKADVFRYRVMRASIYGQC